MARVDPVLVIQIHDIQGWGGAEKAAGLLARAYMKHGHQVLEFYGQKTMASPIRRVYNLKDKHRLEAILEEKRVQFAHLHNFHETLGPSILKPLRERNITTIMTLHDYHLICPVVTLDCGRAKGCMSCDLKRRGWRVPLDRMQTSVREGLMDTVERFICPSKFLFDRFEEVFSLRDRLVHIPNGIFPKEFQVNVPEQARTFYYGGRLATHKGLEMLVETFEDLTEELPGTRLLITGDGNRKRWLMDHIRKRYLGHRITYIGMLPEDELARVRSMVDVAILPSNWPENASMFLLEMMAMGKPVISSDAGGNSEIVTHGKEGLLFEPGSKNGLKEAVRRLHSDSTLVRKLGKNARAKVEEKFDLDVLYGKYRRFIGPDYPT